MHKGLLGVSFLGLAISGYLLVTYVSSDPIVCVSGEGCLVAQLSEYSSFFSIPTPAYGVIFYFTLGIIAAIWSNENHRQLQMPLALLTSIGLGISIFLTYVEAFVIRAWCSWCLGSAFLTIVAFVIAWRLLSRYDYPKS